MSSETCKDADCVCICSICKSHEPLVAKSTLIKKTRSKKKNTALTGFVVIHAISGFILGVLEKQRKNFYTLKTIKKKKTYRKKS